MFLKKNTSGTRPTVGGALTDLLTFVVTVGLLFALRFQAAPIMSPVTFIIPDRESDVRDMPAFFDSVSETMVAVFTIELKKLHPGVFAVQVDDCIERLAVNGVSVIPEKMDRLCSPHDLTRLNLHPYLRSGINTLSISISDVGVTQGLTIHASNTDPLLLALWIGVFLCIVWYALRLRLLLPDTSRWPDAMFVVLLFGLAVRLLYVGATPYNVRAHDMEGHMDYISFMQKNWTVPAAMNGWEFHQPPFYYAVAAGWTSLLSPFQLPQQFVYETLAGWSLVLSILTFAVTLYCLAFLFGVHDRKNAIKAGMLLAVFNGFVFFSSRITNETLSAFLTVATIALLLVWWKRGDRPTLVALALVFSLAFLAKISALALAPALAVALIFRSGRTFKTRITEIILSSLIVVVSVGWYPVHRLFLEPDQEKTLTLGNNGMDATLAVPREFKHLVVLNPAAVIAHPFNDPWDDTFRRGYLLEYFFRSALFGEYKFERMIVLSRTLLILGFLLLPAMLFGLMTDLRRRFRELLPFHIATFGLLAGAFVYPYIFPFAPNQDFRFSVILILPAAYYALRGIDALPLWLRVTMQGVFAAFVLSAFCFIGTLFVNA